MSNRSLDEFDGSADDDESDASDETETVDRDAVDADPHSPTDVAPAVATMRFSPDGAACDDCGVTVTRRWRDGDAFVCADCKAW